MAGQYPLEALLRPAVELYTTTVCFTAAALCIVAPWTFALTPLFGIVAALGFAWLGIVRLKQAGVVLRYRRNIRRLPKYTMTSAEMPVSNEHLFIGKGFRWTQKHTQRLADTYLPQFASYVEPSPLYERARRLEKQLEFAPSPEAGRQSHCLGRGLEPRTAAAARGRFASAPWHRAARTGRRPATGRARRPHTGTRHHAGG